MNTVTSARTSTLEIAYLLPQRQGDSATRVVDWYAAFGVEPEPAARRQTARVRHPVTLTARPVTPRPEAAPLPPDEFARQMRALRVAIVASGEPLLDWDGLDQEIAERRGER